MFFHVFGSAFEEIIPLRYVPEQGRRVELQRKCPNWPTIHIVLREIRDSLAEKQGLEVRIILPFLLDLDEIGDAH